MNFLWAQTRKRAVRGMGLIELVVVMAVMALLLCIALPSFSTVLENRRVDHAVTALATGVQQGRAWALAGNETVRMQFGRDAAGSCYVLFSGAAGACRCSADGRAACAYAVDSAVLKAVGWPAEQGLAVGANVASVVFDPVHGSSAPAATLQVATTSGRAVRHVVNAMGRGRSCSPLEQVAGYPAC
jgi:type IV fimbrial biogenesis protein FimT